LGLFLQGFTYISFYSLIFTPITHMKSFNASTLLFALGLFLLSAPACSPGFDAKGLDNITNIGTKLLDLMNKATSSYNSTAAASLLTEIDKAYEHAQSVKGNKSVAESWRLLKTDIVAPFFEKWKTDGKLDKDFVKEAVATAKKSITAITNAEKAKKK